MKKIEEIIGNLLLRTNCVIIPGFGGFVAKQTSSFIDMKNGIINPPKKSLLFNKQLINNDGLLIAEYAHINNVSYEDATTNIENCIIEWNQELSAGNRISIDKVGFLYFDQERNICFEQDKYYNLLLSSYGLSSVHFLTVEDVKIVQHKQEIQENKSFNIGNTQPNSDLDIVIKTNDLVVKSLEIENKKEKQKNKIPYWKYAAVACLIPFLFYSLWIPLKTDVLESKMLSFQDFNPFHKQVEAQYVQKILDTNVFKDKNDHVSLENQLEKIESKEDVYSYSLNENTYILVDLKETDKVKEEVQKSIIQQNTNVSYTYYIVGCFSDESNALGLIKELKQQGCDAFIKDKVNGLSRVSIGKASNQDELNLLISKSNELGLSGWVLK